MIDYVYNVHGNRVLNWNHEVLSPVNQQTYVDAVTARGAPLPNCFGFIDVTVRPISRPGEHQRLLCNGHEKGSCPEISKRCFAKWLDRKSVWLSWQVTKQYRLPAVKQGCGQLFYR